jgi:hypothetical protein
MACWSHFFQRLGLIGSLKDIRLLLLSDPNEWYGRLQWATCVADSGEFLSSDGDHVALPLRLHLQEAMLSHPAAIQDTVATFGKTLSGWQHPGYD